ncbi:hypothetical protein CHS0354_012684 [Potamilus streckersoni]|uniref:TAFII55 protein conserved region domain-containing protein n=1 Tax=Potamilus streckersoni TaxID=2493646 RepID=A0AAE0W3E2_9BIVA|nr:hypothetical protein CHS0354_012684 [Potamilus streckersoni]
MNSKTVPKKKEGVESAFDLEQNFILRLPPSTAAALRKDVQVGNLRDKLFIELNSDMRRGAIRYGNEFFYAKLVDLPCIIEAQKTVDRKTFYKTADIAQMLVTTTEEDISQDENESPKKKDKDKKFMWNHGITPPLKNVRRRRFRKTLTKKYMEQPDIEKEVKRLFRTDAEAIDVKWEIVNDEEKSISDSGGQSQVEISGSVSGGSRQLQRIDTAASLDLAIFGELSSSEDDEDEKDINIMDTEDEASVDQFAHRQASYLSLDSMASESQDALLTGDTADLQSELGRQLDDITERMLKLEEGEVMDTTTGADDLTRKVVLY